MEIDEVNEARLRAASIGIGYGRSRSMYDLILGWATHVGRLRHEQGKTLATNPDLWNEHDYVAALGIRDFVERGLAMLDADLNGVACKFVSRVDIEYVSFTEEQDGCCDLLSRVAGVESAGREWWWNRMPQEGFILENINRHYR